MNTLLECPALAHVYKATREIREALDKYDYLISSYSTSPQKGCIHDHEDDEPCVMIRIPTTQGDVADQILVRCFASKQCSFFYEYQDKEMEEMLGYEEYECSFEDLIKYMEQLPKPLHAFCEDED